MTVLCYSVRSVNRTFQLANSLINTLNRDTSLLQGIRFTKMMHNYLQLENSESKPALLRTLSSIYAFNLHNCMMVSCMHSLTQGH